MSYCARHDVEILDDTEACIQCAASDPPADVAEPPIEDVRAELDARGIDVKSAMKKVLMALRTAERCERLEDALRLVLPLAKGYSAAHPCESNSRYVAIADAALAGDPA